MKKTESQQEPTLEQQARAALVAHYTKKGLKGDELTQIVDRVMATQFKAREEYPYANEEQMRKANVDLRRQIADAERENEDLLREWEPLSQSIN
jgi:hypothetical protein